MAAHKEKEEDRISELPDCILLLILSFIGCTKQIFRTSLLSKRWQYLWLHISEFHLANETSSRDDGKVSSFMDFVSKILYKLSGTDYLNKFPIEILFYGDSVDKIHLAIKKDVENIKLICRGNYYYYQLPQIFYTNNSSLTSLSLRGCKMAPPQAAIKWECLKYLFLDDVYLTHSVLENILSGCRVLEVLSLTECLFPEVKNYILNISLPSLTTLTINNWIGKYFEITAPYVLNLSIHHHNYYCGESSFLLKNVSSDVRTNLSLNAHLDMDSISDIIAFMESAVNLETLFIKWVYGKRRNSNDYNVKMDLNLSNLKTVKITFLMLDRSGEPMLTMAQLLLEKAIVLEKLVIRAEGLMSRVSSMDLDKIAQKLCSFPRASHEAIVEFKEYFK